MKRNKKIKAGTKILIRYTLTIAVTCVLLFILINIFEGSLLTYAVRFVRSRFSQESINIIETLYKTGAIQITTCLFVLAVVTFIFFIKTARYIDKGYNALSGILDEDYEAPPLPSAIRGAHKKLESNIKNALGYREYLAKEAEQRKNDLVAYLAHDLKTPLTSIIGYLTLLEESPELPIKYRAKFTSLTLEKAYRLEQLINEFFDITRFNIQSIVLEKNRFDLVMMLRQIAEEFYPLLAEKKLTCSFYTDGKIEIVGDADKLSRVFDNLMRNAVSYSYKGTDICITAHAQDGKAVISFRNSGDEITEEKLKLIFEKFFRVDDSRSSSNGGAGLGLAIAKEIVEKHSGEITAKSDSMYTTFTVTLKIQDI